MKEFYLGSNYWASNAGTDMWREFSPKVIREDFKALTEQGLTMLRVFPNWRDFQPVEACNTYANQLKEYRMTDGSRPDNPYYLDKTMLERFGIFCDLAEEYGLELIVGILTGWMSGRCFTPPVLDGRELYTDPKALWLEELYIKGFVKVFKDKKAIYAWDLGNECNCLGVTSDRHVAAYWSGLVSSMIRANDPTRPIVSGMHSLSTAGAWRIADQGEHCEILTTHPYPYFVPHAYKDEMTSYRTLLHATCESTLYADLSGRPCLVEEIGTLGPMMCDEEHAAVFIRSNLYSNWAHGSPGLLWWCGFDQTLLKKPPYTWHMLERELGLITTDHRPKKPVLAMKDFKDFLKTAPALPPMKRDAVCILTHGQDTWGVGYMSWCLAKAAGLNLRFEDGWEALSLPESENYILPSVSGSENIRLELVWELLERVKKGAALLITNQDAFLPEFKNLTGMEVINSGNFTEGGELTLNGKKLPFRRSHKVWLGSAGAEVLAADDQGIPCFTCYPMGEGRVYYVNFPLEAMLIEENNAFDRNLEEIYRTAFAETLQKHPAAVRDSRVGVTFHEDARNTYAVLVNYSADTVKTGFALREGWKTVEAWGDDVSELTPGGGAVVRLERENV